jgi:putative aldouronate transport system permease protein
VVLVKKLRGKQFFVNILLIALCAAVLYPFLLTLGISMTDEKAISEFGYRLIPSRFSLEAYEFVFKNPESVFNAYKITAFYSFASMALSVFLIALIAYPLSKRAFKQKNAVSFYLYFTMLFSGGLVPAYLLLTRYLHLKDTVWIYILPGLINPWYVFMVRTFFQSIPEALCESAGIDGANEYTIFFRIILPLSKPALATVALFTFLGKWNDWFTSMLYIDNEKLISLQYLLQRIMQNLELLRENQMNADMLDVSSIPSESARMAMAVIVAGPALLVFPFFQKYFVKGLTVGSVKG